VVKSFYFITDADLSRQGIIADARDALAAGVRIVQYRAKNATTKEMVEEARKLRAVCRYAFFLVNDRVDVCLASAADGVHLGQDDMPLALARKLLGREKIIGITVHTVAEAMEAQKRGADYLGVSPIFETSTKHDAGKAAGIRLIREIKQRTRLPLVAIGGITLSNAPSVIAAGADCLCAVSVVVAAQDVKAEIAKFQELLNEKR
jgi:thiamine-phosphate pyrophosphorylase